MKTSMAAVGSLIAARRPVCAALMVASITALGSGCSTLLPAAPPAPATSAPAAPPPSVAAAPAPVAPPVVAAPAPPPVLPLDDALLAAANNLFSSASKALTMPPTQRLLVIDPLVDGVSHTQTVTTQSLETKTRGWCARNTRASTRSRSRERRSTRLRSFWWERSPQSI